MMRSWRVARRAWKLRQASSFEWRARRMRRMGEDYDRRAAYFNGRGLTQQAQRLEAAALAYRARADAFLAQAVYARREAG